jgi:hypothetical protein
MAIKSALTACKNRRHIPKQYALLIILPLLVDCSINSNINVTLPLAAYSHRA